MRQEVETACLTTKASSRRRTLAFVTWHGLGECSLHCELCELNELSDDFEESMLKEDA